MIKVLKTLNNEMTTNLTNYAFDEWQGNGKLPYYVGEISEVNTFDEDGQSEYNFIITGLDKKYSNLFKASDKLKSLYKYGKKIIIEDGSAVVISYENTITVPTDAEDLKRTQINLNIKLWENK